MTEKKAITLEHALYLLALCLALAVRLIGLGALPFNETEASWAWQAYQVAHSEPVQIGSQPAYVLFYVLTMVVVAVHVSHGFWSAFQTLGANHPKYMPLVTAASVGLAVVIGVGFGFIPVYVALS